VAEKEGPRVTVARRDDGKWEVKVVVEVLDLNAILAAISLALIPRGK
jgi:hypothetical protein